jgi:hypothetical protein
MMTNDIFDRALGHAISLTLSDWQDGMTDQQIWEAVSNEDWDKVTVWEPFEDWKGEYLASYIEQITNNILTFHNMETDKMKHSLMDAFLGKDYK